MQQRDFARSLRIRMTDAERLLWMHLRAHHLADEKFRRQQSIGPYIVDFVHFGKRLIIEADGSQHNESASDTQRDAWLASQGFRILRLWNHEILDNIDAVLESILTAMHVAHLSPSPFPARGEGGENLATRREPDSM